jgi:hypothetical protein
MAGERVFYKHKCFDFGHGWAEIDSAYETSRLGVKLHVQAGCPLNQQECRRLAAFLSECADWLDELDVPTTSPDGIVVYVITDGHLHHKIGKAVDFQKRLKQLQTGNGRKLSLVAYLRVNTEQLALRVEAVAQEWLTELRAVGEWFECNSHTALQALYEAASIVGVDSVPISVCVGHEEMNLEEATDGQ